MVYPHAPGKQNLSGSINRVNNDEEKIEEALMRRRFDEWTFRGVSLLFPMVLAMAGWALTLETRISEISTQLAERGPRIVAIETLVAQLHDAIHDPSPKPETKVAIDALKAEHEHLDDRVTRLEERLNSLHNYILALPIRPGPYAPPTPSRRGDLPPPVLSTDHGGG
jgi:hypothetical protein